MLVCGNFRDYKILETDMSFADGYIPTVLVVDDVPANVDILVEHFKEDNINLLVALSGEDALSIARDSVPDLILLDVMMPGLDGYAVCERLKSSPRTQDIPVIFVSAKDSTENEEKGFALGAVDYVSKPYALPILKARVRNHLELKRKTDLLSELANIDGLTGIPNRRHFDEILEQEWNRCLRSELPLSLIMIDVDHFKLYNDYYGHGMGDECLQNVAFSMQEAINRPGDLLARYGGEEFVVILPEIDEANAAVIAEKFRKCVTSLQIPHEEVGEESTLTISLGCASTIPKMGVLKESLLENADQSLYKAKFLGRNQVCRFSTILN